MAHSIAVGELPVAGEESPRESAVLPQRHKSSIRVRLAALFTLCAVLGGIIYMAHAAYQAARDSLVAPLILSPDSDVVLSNKLKMNELQVERTRASAEIEGCEADLQAAQSAVVRLKELYRTTTSSRAWIANVTTHQATAAAVELRTLADQKRVLDSMVEKQTQLVEKARTDMEAGIISRTDYAREAQTLDQMNLAIFEN